MSGWPSELALGNCSTRTPSFSSCFFFFSSAKEQSTSTSSAAVVTMRDSRGRRSRESRTTRRSGRRRGMAAAIGEQRIIGDHRANTHQNRVMLMTKLLHMGAS